MKSWATHTDMVTEKVGCCTGAEETVLQDNPLAFTRNSKQKHDKLLQPLQIAIKSLRMNRKHPLTF